MHTVAAQATEDSLLKESKDGLLALTLNRPKVLNALTHAMLSRLLEEFKKAEKDDSVRCIVLAASGRAFCSGADLGDLKKQYETGQALSLGDELRRYFNPLIAQIRNMEKPVLAAIQGVAAGAGASLALACDIKICSEEAKFMLAFIQVGLAPDSGITHMMARRLGLSLALEHAWTARPISASQALHAGLVNHVVPLEQLMPTLREIAQKIVQAPPRAVALTKRALNRALDNNFSVQMEYEAQLQEILGRTQDHREGVAAFMENRPPRFTGT